MTPLSRVAAPTAMLLLVACAPEIQASVRPLTTASSGVAGNAFDDAYESGKSQLRANRAALAMAFFEKALAIDPTSVAALNAIGAAYDEMHLPDRAASYYRRALTFEPQSADTLNNMGMSALIAGRPEQARELFRQALAIDPDNPVISANLALVEPKPPKDFEDKKGPPPDRGPVIEQVGPSSYRILVRGEPQ